MLTELPTLTPEAGSLLARAIFPDPERIARTLKAYRTVSECRVFVWMEGGRMVSAAGLQTRGGPPRSCTSPPGPARRDAGTRGRCCTRWPGT